MKIRFKDLYNNKEVVELDIRNIKIMTGDQNKTILIENVDGTFYRAIVIEFV